MRVAPLAACIVLLAACAPAPQRGDEPWLLARDASWADASLLSHGYVAVTKGSQRYYCRIEDAPLSGSRLNPRALCHDAATLELNDRLHP